MSRLPVVFEPDDRGGVTVVVDGFPQSHVHLDDPGLLTFEYVDHLAAVIDVLTPGALRVTHIGGAGMTLPRYVATARPGSAQIVLEPDAELTAAVRATLPLPRGHRIRVRAKDGRAGLPGLAAGSADIVVLDAFATGVVPGELTTLEGLAAIRRVLADPAVLVANLLMAPADGMSIASWQRRTPPGSIRWWSSRRTTSSRASASATMSSWPRPRRRPSTARPCVAACSTARFPPAWWTQRCCGGGRAAYRH